jgi:mono/diheme cytochrome c family protein
MRTLHAAFLAAAAVLILIAAGLALGGDKPKPGKSLSERVEHGRYLVTLGGCNHCHSPKTMSPSGPVPHPLKLLSGYPAETNIPEIPAASLAKDKWGAITNSDLTAWAGPWGVSFAANLTPDPATGLGGWTEGTFIKTLRTGKHMGTGRQILPPMPWADLGQLTDEDLGDMFAYLKSIPPVRNAVPQPIPPGSGSH